MLTNLSSIFSVKQHSPSEAEIFLAYLQLTYKA